MNFLRVEQKKHDTVIEVEQQIDIEFQRRRTKRMQTLKTIKSRVIIKEKQKKQRKRQNYFLFFLSLTLPIALSCFNAYIFLKLGKQSELKGIVLVTLVSIGLIVSILSNLQLTSPLQVLKLYFHLDSLVPVLISGIISFFGIFNYLSTNEWYEVCFTVCYPVWVVYFLGYLRVTIAYGSWHRWQVVSYKLVVCVCGLIFFYVGVDYMNGTYKVTGGLVPFIENKIKDFALLYVFGNTELFFEMYRKLSSFDKSEELSFDYRFTNIAQEEQEIIFQRQAELMEKKMEMEEMEQQIEVIRRKTKKMTQLSKLGNSQSQNDSISAFGQSAYGKSRFANQLQL